MQIIRNRVLDWMSVAFSIPPAPHLSVHCSCMSGRLQETRGKLFESAILLGSCPRTCTSSHRALRGKTAAMNYYSQENSVLAVHQ